MSKVGIRGGLSGDIDFPARTPHGDVVMPRRVQFCASRVKLNDVGRCH
ncbi:MAG: hypothetical protein ACPGAQ_03325 [Candidatus Puniceispirillaceae bacterium]|jgi:hypothetical protein